MRTCPNCNEEQLDAVGYCDSCGYDEDDGTLELEEDEGLEFENEL